jgi:hypothetical protein
VVLSDFVTCYAEARGFKNTIRAKDSNASEEAAKVVQLSDDDILNRIISSEITLAKGIAALCDRDSGRFRPPEGQLHDYKEIIRVEQISSMAEIARDILAFSNSDGGLLIAGVRDDRMPVGHTPVDFRRVRDALGIFMGTRVDFDLEEVLVTVRGKTYRLLAVLVRRSRTAYPSLLRKDIEIGSGSVRKMKYIKGTLFYRKGHETLAESPYGDIESRARELRFSEAAPRTRTSFLLQEDKPGLRLYAPINDRFYGREAELAELISKFDDPRGRGVSVAGFGGMGKTELGIRLVGELYRRGKFRTVYSGSAKQTLLGPGGVQQVDPVFMDLPTFLNDLAGWLGFNPLKMQIHELASACLEELAKLKRVLLFVDNLETVTDTKLLSFLDDRLPPNCWLVATARVHKIRSFVYPKELREMEENDAAHLLRHELKRQGLDTLASTAIEELEAKAKYLFCHPLAIRWFAWACRNDLTVWTIGIGRTDIRELENFCVAHTLGSLDPQTQRVLGATLAISGVAEATYECIQQTSGLNESVVEHSLWELECSGMVYGVTDENGLTTFSVAPLAERPTAELSQKQRWEGEFVHNLSSYVKLRRDSPPDSPLVRDLLRLDPRRIQDYTPEEKQELVARIERALPRCPEKFKLKLMWLKAECHRHMESPVSADNVYEECAKMVLAQGPVGLRSFDNIRILLEAATVAKIRAQTEPQLRRALSYLKVIEADSSFPLRVLGTSTELHALLGDRANYEAYLKRVTNYRESHGDLRDSHLDALDDALERAKGHLERIERSREQSRHH